MKTHKNGKSPYIVSRALNSSYYYMEDENEIRNVAHTVVVNQPAPVAKVESESDDDGENEAVLEQIGERIESLENRIEAVASGEREWTTAEISSLKTEIADLRATLQEVGTNLPTRMQELENQMAELIRKSQEPPQEVVEEITPPIIPPDPQENGDGTLETVTATVVSASATESPKSKKRVI